jgi:hypothetical protein
MGTDRNMTDREKRAQVDISQVKSSDHIVILSINECISKIASSLTQLISNI